ncbi:MAG: prolyl oligopeptidase family serine peptidase, partial [Opitutaceae bacterium]|nr:prolyl oligopeptidase family serine peptidase [Opitutaceae bacterium]
AHRMRRIFAVFLLAALVASLRAATLETYQAIHAPLECETAAISPDGKRLAAIVRGGGHVEVRVFDLDVGKANVSARLDPETAGLPAFDRILWVSPTRLVAQAGRREIVAIDADGGNHKRVVDWEQPHWYGPQTLTSVRAFPRNVRVIAWSADEPEFVHVEAAWLSQVIVVRVHLGSGKSEVRWEGSGDAPMIYDRAGAARIRTVSRDTPEGYELRAISRALTRWIPLDRVLGTDKSPEFVLTAANVCGPRSIPLGFDRDPEVLYLASNVGRDTFGIYALDLRTKRRTGFAIEDPNLDLAPPFLPRNGEDVLVRERKTGQVVGARIPAHPSGTLWLDSEVRGVQERIARMAWDYAVRIENWDDARERFLVRLSHRAEPGGFAVYSRADGKLSRFLDRAPRMAALSAVHSTEWIIKKPDGARLTGHLTMPLGRRNAPLPVVVVTSPAILSPPILGSSVPDYLPVTRALVEMGFAVLEVAHRGSIGHGLAHWEAGRGRLDEVVADDVFMALDRVGAEAKLDHRKVAVVGSDFGATLALRLSILRPERVACVVVDGRLADIRDRVSDGSSTEALFERMRAVERLYFGPTDERLKKWSPAMFAAELTRPVMVVTLQGASASYYPSPTNDFLKRLKATKRPAFVLEESAAKGRSEMNARVSVAIEKFLAEHLPIVAR